MPSKDQPDTGGTDLDALSEEEYAEVARDLERARKRHPSKGEDESK